MLKVCAFSSFCKFVHNYCLCSSRVHISLGSVKRDEYFPWEVQSEDLALLRQTVFEGLDELLYRDMGTQLPRLLDIEIFFWINFLYALILKGIKVGKGKLCLWQIRN